MSRSPDRHARATLPIADRPPPTLTTYDAKDPGTAFPASEPLLLHNIDPEERLRIAMARQ